ncbi:uncharacterized protein DUF3501 [Nitrosospira sp. Nsp5]|uniref:DUF3501 family protein n=1 Tax=Nitrosospira multiformis TaxID=1231 RepID=A0ABY0TE72_9PROT|nr:MULTISPECIES: DUF3501 family protein [Nitrosospira]PTR05843.1 uncharacterized protein DUF3501 [Nitrosospira sp. Nsp5]SDQ60910.1 Protein of unknown function [Nitrosospira multiformis]
MPQITRDSLMTLEAYAKARQEFRAKVMAHKKNRKVYLGENVTLIFEDELTIRYQIQEMLRVEKIFEEEGILDELDAYGPLVPDGGNWKATMMIEYPDPVERAARLAELTGIEDRVWVRVHDHDPVYAIADEDLERENAEKTSSVHFLRFELGNGMIKALRQGAPLSMGIAHPAYEVPAKPVTGTVRDALINDLTADLAT